MTSDDLKWPQMTSKNEIRKKYVYMGIILTQIQFYLIILTFWWPQMTSNDPKWPQMTSKNEIRKKYVYRGIILTQIQFYFKILSFWWPQMTSGDLRWPQMTPDDLKKWNSKEIRLHGHYFNPNSILFKNFDFFVTRNDLRLPQMTPNDPRWPQKMKFERNMSTWVSF